MVTYTKECECGAPERPAVAYIGDGAWGMSLKLLMGAVCASGGVMLGTYKYMQDKVLTDPNVILPSEPKKKKTKVKMGMREVSPPKLYRIVATREAVTSSNITLQFAPRAPHYFQFSP